MNKKKILILCPGSWTYGLNSPERGEGRWAQNIAKMLGEQDKYEVYACSGGDPANKIESNVHLLKVEMAAQYNPFDLYIDPCWWEGKITNIQAKKYLHTAWYMYNDFERIGFPDNHYICFPFIWMKSEFINKRMLYADKTFFIPAPYCKEFGLSHFDKKHLIWSTRTRNENAAKLLEYIQSYINNGYILDWMYWEEVAKRPLLKRYFRKDIPNAHYITNIPYNLLRSIIDKSKLALTVKARGSILDCISLGIPPLIWEEGVSFEGLRTIAKKYNLLINDTNLEKVFTILMTNKDIYDNYLIELQQEFIYHKESESLKLFESMMENIFDN